MGRTRPFAGPEGTSPAHERSPPRSTGTGLPAEIGRNGEQGLDELLQFIVDGLDLRADDDLRGLDSRADDAGGTGGLAGSLVDLRGIDDLKAQARRAEVIVRPRLSRRGRERPRPRPRGPGS